jgi:hypothetical protein
MANRKFFNIKTVLVLSLAINIFCLSALGAAYYKFATFKLPPERLYDALHVLDEADRPKIRAIVDQQYPKVEQNFYEMFKLFLRARDLLTSKNLENEKIIALTDELAVRHRTMASIFAETMIRINNNLSEEARIKYLREAFPNYPPFMNESQAKEMEVRIKNFPDK